MASTPDAKFEQLINQAKSPGEFKPSPTRPMLLRNSRS